MMGGGNSAHLRFWMREMIDARLELTRENYPEYFSWRDATIVEAEIAFEHEIHDLPHVVVCPVPLIAEHGEQAMHAYIEHAENWLKTNIQTRYLAFPTSAIGKHKHCCFNVYFEDPRAAILFKIAVI